MYDPLKEKIIPNNQPYPNSYWKSQVDLAPLQTQMLETEQHTDVAIIGAGYAGLSCAHHLMKQHSISPVVLEANNVGWGCSGRNAGFILPLSGRLGYQSLVSRFGMKNTQEIHQQFLEGVSTVHQLVQDADIDVDMQESGYLKIAHKPKYYEQLCEQADYMQEHFGYSVERLTRDQLFNNYCKHQDAHGALRFSHGNGVNPLKVVTAYKKLIDSQNGKIYTNSPVINWTKLLNGKHQLNTPSGSIIANKVVVASNGYTPSHLDRDFTQRVLPVLSSVIVTRPLNDIELEQSGLKTNQVMMDTRALKYYYRKLPDNRVLFGGRGAISGAEADNPKYYQRLLLALKQSFTCLKEVSIDYQWSGWISVSFDDIPHIYEADNNVFYAAGYCGAGLSFSTLAGKRLADKVAGACQYQHLPFYSSALPKIPFTQFKRLGQWGYYQYGRVKDKWL
ncbi:NAD(P)/FAD-dependent oxidoreductase [Flocculibacter collagenilyticus]|uniref:NAD(P)/FAD-dependent oxidoreductase n=1 Tax=Flocculibacter collagenilyticus TaxID=2744479 RepID=UPI0018F54A74|nr:FAD-dependent oxidoreductase [Flocculibacter collagenilyticus]